MPSCGSRRAGLSSRASTASSCSVSIHLGSHQRSQIDKRGDRHSLADALPDQLAPKAMSTSPCEQPDVRPQNVPLDGSGPAISLRRSSDRQANLDRDIADAHFRAKRIGWHGNSVSHGRAHPSPDATRQICRNLPSNSHRGQRQRDRSSRFQGHEQIEPVASYAGRNSRSGFQKTFVVASPRGIAQQARATWPDIHDRPECRQNSCKRRPSPIAVSHCS